MPHTITLLRIHLQENMLQVKLISAPVMMFDNVHIWTQESADHKP